MADHHGLPGGVLEALQELAATVVRDESEVSDREAKWPKKSFGALQSEGLGGLVIPEANGGHGLGLRALSEACALLGEESPSLAISYGMHCVAAAVITAKATDDQSQRYLDAIGQGKHITTLALSEPGTGSHFYYPQAQLSPNGAGWDLNGTKSFITNGSHADSYVVSATTLGEKVDPGTFSCAMVDEATDGMEWQEPYRGFGMRGNSARTVKLQDVHVSQEQLLGEPGDQLWYVFNVVAPFFLTAMAGTYQGIQQRAVKEAVRHLKGRSYDHDGSRLADAPVLQHRIGSLWADMARTREFIRWATKEAESGGPETLPALLSAKAEVADSAVHVVNEVMTLMGGKSYGDDGLMPRLLRDVRASHVMAPTTDLLRIWTGRALLDVPLLGRV